MLERLAAVINADMDLNVSPEMRRQVALRVLQVDSFDDVDATARRIVELLWSERTLH
jgi:hypothetical protein